MRAGFSIGVGAVLGFDLLVLAALVLVPLPLTAGVKIIAKGVSQLYAGAGYSTNTIDTVVFRVPAVNVGDGTPIAGRENGTMPDTLIDAFARAPARGDPTVFWTVDSSQPLVCSTPATCGGTTIPMTRFRWTASGADGVPSAAFDGSSNQLLSTFRDSSYHAVYKTFYYANDEIYPAGQYTGRVVYTVSMP